MHHIFQVYLDDTDRPYTGRELSPHWIYRTYGIEGNALAVFQGPARVGVESLVDVKDAVSERPISSDRMLHFIAEWFDVGLDIAVLRQRLFIVAIKESLESAIGDLYLDRSGDDLYDGTNKLTVSIATASPVSTLMHTGINILTTGTPIPTAGLNDYKLDPLQIAREIIERYQNELEDIGRARCTVSPV